MHNKVPARPWSQDAVSYHRVRHVCGGREVKSIDVPIEPLAGFLRHPHHICWKKQSVAVSKAYLIPPMRHEVMAPSPMRQRSLFFDVGASLYQQGLGGASQAWFVNEHSIRSIAFDRILAWEARNYTTTNILAGLPREIQKSTSVYREPASPNDSPERLTYYNVPVEPRPGSYANPLTHLAHLASPDDFVVFKLDIDSPLIERQLVEQLLADPAMLARVDEFYYEHAVTGSPMLRTWLRGSHGKINETLSASYALFTRLRESGIRAHSWV